MINEAGFRISKPVSLWNRPLKADFKKLFVGLTKSLSQVALQNWASAAKEAVEAVSALGLSKDVGQVAWLLIFRSLTQCMYSLVEEHLELIWRSHDNSYDLSKKKLVTSIDTILHSLEESQFTVDSEFFGRPASLSILKTVKEPFFYWLNYSGLTKHQARAISERLPAYFVYALNDQWRTYRHDYEVLREALDTPFTKATEKELGWSRYSAWLRKQVEEPLFSEAFSLKQLYIPLRAYFERASSQSVKAADHAEADRVVVDLQEELAAWARKSELHDAIRIISGGPGCGKSSFTKMFAASQAEISDRRVLFVPLHRFDPSDDLVDAISRFVQYDGVIPYNPLDPQDGDDRLLIIFDGLDELSMQGKLAAEIAQRFVREVNTKLAWFNSREPRLKIVLSGRELAVQANATEFRRAGQILHVLPYFVPLAEARTYIDRNELLVRENEVGSEARQDHRQQWWANYGRLTGLSYKGLPKVLEREELREITSQPLLNYLLALSYGRGKLDFEVETNINLIYEDLVDAVYERAWAERQHPSVAGLSKQDFVRLLEEIAVAAWHGDSRTTSVKEIELHCLNSGMAMVLERVKEGFKEGIGSLLMAFYFRKFGNRPTGDEAFEFTHKSFGEYLAARRIVRGVRRIHEESRARIESYDTGWDDRECLTSWIGLAGPVSMNEYLFAFIHREIQQVERGVALQWQQRFCHLLGVVLKQGLPFEKLENRPSFKEECRQSRNAEEGLICILNGSSEQSRRLSKINWGGSNSFGEWTQWLSSQTIGNERAFGLSCLKRLDLRDSVLTMKSFERAALTESDLENVLAPHAIFIECDLSRASLKNGNFVEAKFDRTNLRSANLAGASLQDCSFHEAFLENADISTSNLSRADLRNANLFNCKLNNSILHDARLTKANLHSANLQDAKLSGADFRKANLENANLRGARIDGANFSDAKFNGCQWIDGRVIKRGAPDRFVFE